MLFLNVNYFTGTDWTEYAALERSATVLERENEKLLLSAIKLLATVQSELLQSGNLL